MISTCCGIFLLCGAGQVLAQKESNFQFNLQDKIVELLYTVQEKSSLKAVYESTFNPDPYGAVLDDLKNRKKSLVQAGISNIQKEIWKKSCSLSRSEISSILYYSSSAYRGELAGRVLQITNQSLDLTPSTTGTVDACKKYQTCKNQTGILNSNFLNECSNEIVGRYDKGYEIAKQQQRLDLVNIGTDRYWNNDISDSPYDILYDMSSTAKIIFQQVQDAPKFSLFPQIGGDSVIPTYYQPSSVQTPNSSSSSSSNSSNSATSSTTGTNTQTWTNPWTTNTGTTSTTGTTNTWTTNGWTTTPDNEFETFLTNGPSRESTPTIFGGNICLSSASSSGTSTVTPPTPPSTGSTVDTEETTLSDEEYKDYVNNMLDELENYLNPDNNNGSTGGSSGGNNSINRDNPNEADLLDQVKSCVASCANYPRDQKIACAAKCACDTINSPRFDPAKYPGMGPIFKIRFCTVPAVNKGFSSKGKYVNSIEEIYEEWAGITSKLEQGGEVYISKEQKAMLDSSATQENFAKKLRFTIQNKRKKSASKTEESTNEKTKEEIKKEEIIKKNKQLLNFLDDSAGANAYILVKNAEIALNNLASTTNQEQQKAQKAETLQINTFITDPRQVLDQQRYLDLEKTVLSYVQEQLDIWIQVTDYLKEVINITDTLLDKKQSS